MSVNDLHERMLTGHPVLAEHVDEALRTGRKRAEEWETQYVEFKAGDFLANKSSDNKTGEPGKPYKAAAVLRKWVAGFANADGGLLVIGVSEGTKAVTGLGGTCGAVRKNPSEWAGHALSQLAWQLDPPPRIEVVDHPDGQVLLIDVGRSRGLVGCSENGQVIHYVRFGESTLAMPAHLVSDLVTGRRSEPRLVPQRMEARCQNDKGAWKVSFDVFNDSPHWVSAVHASVVSYGQYNGALTASDEVPALPARLAQWVRGEECAVVRRGDRTPPSGDRLKPFEARRVDVRIGLMPAPIEEWRFALFVSAPEAAPRWFEVRASSPMETGLHAAFDVRPARRPVELVLRGRTRRRTR